MYELKPHQVRVIEERQALNDKLEKLEEFLKTTIFEGLDSEEQKRLVQQSILMARYSDALSERIKAF